MIKRNEVIQASGGSRNNSLKGREEIEVSVNKRSEKL